MRPVQYIFIEGPDSLKHDLLIIYYFERILIETPYLDTCIDYFGPTFSFDGKFWSDLSALMCFT